MEQDDYDRFEQYIREGWQPHQDTRRYLCGWCGHALSTSTGFFKLKEWIPIDEYYGGPFVPNRRSTDIRICPECWVATTFLDKDHQLPGRIKGDNLDPREKSDDVKLIVTLYNEARVALSRAAPSCAVLMCRKLFMHVAVERGAKTGLRFIQYVDYLKNQGIVGKPQHSLLDRIRDGGNEENHEVVRATPERAEELLDFVTLLIRSVYFSD